ncbi:BLUF domain-containing protein [Methylobacterium brachiatum]
MSELYRLVYASKNMLHGSEAELTAIVGQILATSQRNNARSDVTGALMFNAGAFAQVLEGPRRGVEETFERIQCDDRHSDVTVLQCGPTESRSFANWSMAFVGQSAGGQEQFSRLAAESGFDLARLDGDAVFAMLHELVLEEEGLPRAPRPAPPAEPAARGLDVAQLRAEMAQLRPDGAVPQTASAADGTSRAASERNAPRPHPIEDIAPAKAATEAALAVLKLALAAERQRTSDLRTEIDGLQVSLAVSRDQRDALRVERDRWAERARLLAAAMAQEAGDAQTATHPGGSPDAGIGAGAAADILAA